MPETRPQTASAQAFWVTEDDHPLASDKARKTDTEALGDSSGEARCGADQRERSVVTALLVVVGAIVGAPMGYLTDRAVQARHDSVFPWGTLAVNVAGSFVLGTLVAGAAAGARN